MLMLWKPVTHVTNLELLHLLHPCYTGADDFHTQYNFIARGMWGSDFPTKFAKPHWRVEAKQFLPLPPPSEVEFQKRGWRGAATSALRPPLQMVG
jgi:hypothetical protein